MIAWEPNPYFVNGEYCAARQLNAVCHNIQYLHGWVDMPVMPFSGEEKQHHIAEAASWKNLWLGYIRHKANMLYVDIQVKGINDRIGYIELLYNGVIIGSAQSADNAWHSMASPIDISGQGLTIGNYYTLQVRHKSSEDYHPDTGRVFYMYEADIGIPDNSGTWRTPDGWLHLNPGRGNTTDVYPQFYTFSKDLLWLKGHLFSANWAVRRIEFQANQTDGGFCSYGNVHRMRWLHHLGAGEIVFGERSHNFEDANPDVPKTIWGIFDLESLNWLPYGVLYYIQTERTPGEIIDRAWEDSTFELMCAFEDATL